MNKHSNFKMSTISDDKKYAICDKCGKQTDRLTEYVYYISHVVSLSLCFNCYKNESKSYINTVNNVNKSIKS